MPCTVAVGYQRFRGPCCLHLQGEVAKIRVLPTDRHTDRQTDRQSVSLSIHLGFEPLSRTHGHILALQKKVLVLCHEAPSLMGGQVCHVKGHSSQSLSVLYICVCVFGYSFFN